MAKLLDHLRKGSSSREDEIERTPGKTYRNESLKRRRVGRRTSVSTATFSVTKILITLVLTIAVLGTLGYITLWLFDLAMNW